ncbi:MAG: stalk domain-containing protein [Bacillota bacterium]
MFFRQRLAPLALALLLLLLPQAALAAGYSVVVNGRTVTDAQAELRSGQLMVSVRPFVEAMGGNVYWNSTAQMATISYKGSQLALWIGTHLGFQNGSKVWAPVAPYLRSGRTMVPAWWTAARLGAKVSYSNNTLYVNTGSTAPAPTPPTRPSHVLAKPGYVFPFPAGAAYQPYVDTMGDSRYWQGRQFPHEGTDILAARGTPIVAVASGTVVRYGWNTLGGYRVTIQLDDHPEYRFYYAHLDRYAPGLWEGARVKTGQLLGYVGSTGEGPERTEGKFVDHLHFGIYGPNGAINPYSLLKYWEANKIRLP